MKYKGPLVYELRCVFGRQSFMGIYETVELAKGAAQQAQELIGQDDDWRVVPDLSGRWQDMPPGRIVCRTRHRGRTASYIITHRPFNAPPVWR